MTHIHFSPSLAELFAFLRAEIPVSPCLGVVVESLMLEAIEDVECNALADRLKAAMWEDLDGEED